MSKLKEYLKKCKIIVGCYRTLRYCASYIGSVYMETIWFHICFFLRKCGLISCDSFVTSLKDKYLGKDIYVIATGPSLSVEDLELIHNSGSITISMNGIFKVFSQTTWRPDYYVMDDYWLIQKYMREYKDICFDRIGRLGAVYTDKVKGIIPNVSEMENVGLIPVCYFDHWETHHSKKMKYNRNISCGNYDLYTVTNFAINLADYMGAGRIFLLGVDCNYTASIQHVGQENIVQWTEEEKKNLIDMEYGMISGYRTVSELIRDDLQVINVTRGGNLEVFPRMTLEESFEKQEA